MWSFVRPDSQAARTQTKRSAQSCDQCHARRKRCDRCSPCALCVTSELQCTYTNKLKKRGPKGKVIQRLRSEQGADIVPWDGLDIDFDEPGSSSSGSFDITSVAFDTPSQSLAITPASSFSPVLYRKVAGLRSSDYTELIGTYFKHIHPCYPLLDRQWFLDRLERGEMLDDSQGPFLTLVLAVCALTMAFESKVLDQRHERRPAATRDGLVSEIVLRHYTQPLGQSTTLEQVITTYLMGLYFAIVHGDQAGHFRIAEAAHLAKSMQLHLPETYQRADASTRQRYLSVFACIVAANRACVLRQGLSEIVYMGEGSILDDPNGLRGYIEVPSGISEGSDAMQHLSRILALYQIVSPSFAQCARNQCDRSSCHLSPSTVARYARHLQNIASIMPADLFEVLRPCFSPLEETRWIEFLVAYRWLAAFTWRIAMRHNIDMTQLEGGVFGNFPLEILDVAQIVSSANVNAIRALGTGIVHRLYDIGACAMAFLQANAVEGDAFERASAELQRIFNVIEEWDPKYWTRCVF